MTPLLLSVKSAAEYIGVSPRTIEEYVAQGLFPVVQLPHPKLPEGWLKKVLIPREEIDRFVKERGRRLA